MHPLRVALKVAETNTSDEIISAAILHDTLEDENDEEENNIVSYNSLVEQLSKEVADIVFSLSDNRTITDRATRKQRALEKLETASKAALLIKTADIIENTDDLVQFVKTRQTIPWDVFHFTPKEKIARWLKVRQIVQKRYPDCPLLPKLENNLKILKKIVSN